MALIVKLDNFDWEKEASYSSDFGGAFHEIVNFFWDRSVPSNDPHFLKELAFLVRDYVDDCSCENQHERACVHYKHRMSVAFSSYKYVGIFSTRKDFEESLLGVVIPRY